jgi:nitrate reductase (NAD(P)H)
MLVAGEDATDDFMTVHSSDAKRRLVDFHIGTLDGTIETNAQQDPGSMASFPNPKIWKMVILATVRDASKDTKIYVSLLFLFLLVVYFRAPMPFLPPL